MLYCSRMLVLAMLVKMAYRFLSWLLYRYLMS